MAKKKPAQRQSASGSTSTTTAVSHSEPPPGHGEDKEKLTKLLKPLKSPVTRQTLLENTRNTVLSIYKDVVGPLGEAFHFRSAPSEGELRSTPMVVFLGNHSSGKSTFINYLLDRKELQPTGSAPMDDGFTVITYGDREDEQAGPTVVNNNKLQYCSLKSIGDQFIQRFRLKYLTHPLLKEVTLVDSPGMIDSVGDGRGYEIGDAVHWFAARADFVIFFFDPEKPGTTGESLKVFTEALSGIDHKLLILMNKVDTFNNISDFVRCYGTLCWNLAKVIPYKDMPYIYTTFAPTNRPANKGDALERALRGGEADGSVSSVLLAVSEDTMLDEKEDKAKGWSLGEFRKARDKIIRKINSAPSRHADNMITELKKYVSELVVHAEVLSAAKTQLWWYRIRCWAILIMCVMIFTLPWTPHLYDMFIASGPGAAPISSQDMSFLFMGVGVLLFFLMLGALFIIPFLMRSKERELISNSHLTDIFEKLYAGELMSDQADYWKGMWEMLLPSVKSTAERFGLFSFPTFKKAQKVKLEGIVEHDIQTMLDNVLHHLKRE